uniref:MIR domain-containing protein n=1 Tax=Rhizophagus irregularis (strain DAOM 181602 / DAOM 197198 / MUCL 43194) TaxID=747089 RepID=U9V572_RHIID
MSFRCHFCGLEDDKDILEFCKSMIHPSINVSKANTFEEILNILKTDTLFTLFKYSVKEKLQVLKFDPEDENHTQFINIFRDVLRKRKLIHFGSCITLRHDSTRRYLTSCDVRYITGSTNNIVYANQTLFDPNSLWIVLDPDQKNGGNPVTYGSKICLKNEATDKNLIISNESKSPSTGNWEVNCTDAYYNPYFINSDSSDNNKIFIKSKEIINLRDEWCIELYEIRILGKVFVEQTFLVLNSIWVISTADKLPDKPSESEPVFYGNTFYLFHKTTGKKVDIDQSYKSPVTQNAEVSITSFKNETRCQLMATNSAKNNNDLVY